MFNSCVHVADILSADVAAVVVQSLAGTEESAPVPNLKLPEDNPAVVDDATYSMQRTFGRGLQEQEDMAEAERICTRHD